jgi:hypothetical protein
LKSFKQYIIESQYRDIPNTFYLSKDGRVITAYRKPFKSQFFHHAYIPITQPEDFGMTQEEMDQHHDIFPGIEMEDLHDTGESGAQHHLQTELAHRGFFQGSRYEGGIHIEAHGHGDIHDIHAALHGLRRAYPNASIPELSIYGIKKHTPEEIHPDISSRMKPIDFDNLSSGSLKFTNSVDIDRFLGIGRKSGRDPGSGLVPVPSPAEAMSKAGRIEGEPEFLRRGRFFQSDSYNFSNLIGQILSESASEGIYGEMHRSILDRIVSHMQQNHPNLPISKENIKNTSAHDVLLSPRPEKNRSEMRINTYGDYEDEETGEISDREHNYSFKIHPGGGKAWHSVEVSFRKYPARDYRTPGTGPFKTDLQFTVNGEQVKNAIPSHDTESMSEVYQGVMDAITHHAITHNLTDKDYDFTPTADTIGREKAKKRRYSQMLNIFSAI